MQRNMPHAQLDGMVSTGRDTDGGRNADEIELAIGYIVIGADSRSVL